MELIFGRWTILDPSDFVVSPGVIFYSWLRLCSPSDKGRMTTKVQEEDDLIVLSFRKF